MSKYEAFVSREYLERALDAQAKRIIQQKEMLSSLQAINAREVRLASVLGAVKFLVSVIIRKIIK